jgi:hypothetical protein
VKERLSLTVLSTVKASGSDLAYPTRTIHTNQIPWTDNFSDSISLNS